MKMEAERPFGLWTASAMVVGGMIGAGIFVLPIQLAPLGTTGVVAWLVAIGGVLSLAWVLSGLAAARPLATGCIAICGEALGPLTGVLVGWAYWITTWSSLVVLASAAVRYLGQLVPVLNASPAYLTGSALSMIWIITLYNLTGARAVGRLQVITTVLKLLPLLAVILILIGLAASGGDVFRAEPHSGFELTALAPAVNLVLYALVGFEASGAVAERVRDPARNVPRSTLYGMLATGLIYLVVCSGIVFALPADVVANSPAPVALFVETYWGHGAGLAIAAFAAISAIGCLNGWVLVQGELPLGMARAGLLPSWIGRTDRRDVPVGAVLVSSTLASILLLLGATRGTAGLFDLVMRLTATTSLYLYAGLCLAALVMGVRRISAVVGLAFSLWAIWGAGLEAASLGLVLMLTALPLYWLRPRGPVSAPQPAE